METIDYGKCTIDFDDQLAILTLRDPDRLNAIGEDMIEGCHRALLEIAKPRRAVRCLLIVGEGRAFCAGANLGVRKPGEGPQTAPVLSRVESVFHPFMRRLQQVKIPMIAAVQGACVGIGVAIALTADHLVAADDAYFLVPFRNLASAPDSGLTWLLPRAIGIARARSMLMQAKRVPASDALAWGMVTETVACAEFAERARAVAREYADGPTIALSEMKVLLGAAGTRWLDEQMEAESRAVLATSRTKDNVAAIRAFAQKAKPSFTGE